MLITDMRHRCDGHIIYMVTVGIRLHLQYELREHLSWQRIVLSSILGYDTLCSFFKI